MGDAAEPEYRGFRVSGFEVEVHEFEQLEQEGFGDGVVLDAEEFDGVGLLEEKAACYPDILCCNQVYNVADEYVTVYPE